MKYSLVAIFALSMQSAFAYPGMKTLQSDLKKRIAQAGTVDGDAPAELLGDLVTGITTPTGKIIANILTGSESGQSSAAGYFPPGMPGSAACKKDTCCIWSYVSMAMTAAFLGPTGRCNDLARAAIRLGFHDAGTWKRGMTTGGADGSIVLAPGEISRADNKGLESVVQKAKDFQTQFGPYGVGMADLIQFGAVHAAVTCPLGPRVRFFAGRKDSTQLPPEGLLPGVSQSADALIALFNDKTIPPHQLAALVGAHSTSKQFFVDAKRSGASQDSTPGVWDTRFYNETLSNSTSPRVFKFQSDVVLSADPRVNSEWLAFAAPDGQSHWNEDYANAYTRLSLLGVNNINNLTECSK
jgi:hypothetical protein